MPWSVPTACPMCGAAECKCKRLYDNRKWRRESAEWMDDHPECAACGRTVYRGPNRRHSRKGCVDHIIPHRNNEQLFWDKDNWQTLCASCHGGKSSEE